MRDDTLKKLQDFMKESKNAIPIDQKLIGELWSSNIRKNMLADPHMQVEEFNRLLGRLLKADKDNTGTLNRFEINEFNKQQKADEKTLSMMYEFKFELTPIDPRKLPEPAIKDLIEK